MSDYIGIDYSLGKANFDKDTGIHFGVISCNSVHPDVFADFLIGLIGERKFIVDKILNYIR